MVSVFLTCLLAAVLTTGIATPSPRSAMESNSTKAWARDLLKESMDWLDMYYDADAGYLYSLDAKALTHETRASAWYAAGLLSRNEAGDVDEAVKIVENVIAGQHKNRSAQW